MHWRSLRCREAKLVGPEYFAGRSYNRLSLLSLKSPSLSRTKHELALDTEAIQLAANVQQDWTCFLA